MNDGILYLLNLAGKTIAALEAQISELRAQLAEAHAAHAEPPAGPEPADSAVAP